MRKKQYKGTIFRLKLHVSWKIGSGIIEKKMGIIRIKYNIERIYLLIMNKKYKIQG